MTADEIIETARAAGALEIDGEEFIFDADQLQAFAKAIAAKVIVDRPDGREIARMPR